MKNENNISENLENEAPFLSKIERKNHFSTPKNYFEVLPELISSKNLKKNSLKYYFDKLSYRILIPSTSLIVLLFVVLNWNTSNTSTEITNEQLSEFIIEEDYMEMDNYLVYETYAEILEEKETEEEEYIDYLIDNDIDINSIIEEL